MQLNKKFSCLFCGKRMIINLQDQCYSSLDETVYFNLAKIYIITCPFITSLRILIIMSCFCQVKYNFGFGYCIEFRPSFYGKGNFRMYQFSQNKSTLIEVHKYYYRKVAYLTNITFPQFKKVIYIKEGHMILFSCLHALHFSTSTLN